MTYEKHSVITRENKTTSNNALRAFYLWNGSMSQTFFSLNAPDLPNASTKELESNKFRANRYYWFKNEN